MDKSENITELDIAPFWEALEKLFAVMNAKYDQVASCYGFQCRGCDDNCCKTRFYHHTYLEVFYLKKGLDELNPQIKGQVISGAADICSEERKNTGEENVHARIMCPANIDGRCMVYKYRPMICRLHGIPSEWTFPSPTGKNRTVISSGCEEFERQTKKRDYLKFDRTPLYMEMSLLEKRFKRHFGFNQKIKMTVAQIIANHIVLDSNIV